MLADQEQQANFHKQAAGRSSVSAAHPGQRIIDRALLIRLLVLSYDMLVGAAAMAAGVYLRLGEQAWPILSSPEFLTGVAVFMALVGMTGRIVGLNSGLWRYASIADLIAIVKTASFATLGFLAFMFLYSRLEAMPRTSLVTAWALLILLMAGARLTYRVFRNRSIQRRAEGAGSKMAVLIGADGRSEMFIKAVSERPNMAYSVAAVFDDRNRRTGMTMRGIPVIGSLGELEHIVTKCARDGRPLQSIIVTKHRSEMAPGVLDSIIEWGADNGYDLLQAPAQEDMSGHGSEDFELTPLRIEDLLGRPSADLNTQALRDLIGDMTVLVTGAGGSIGGELCRQVVQYAPKRIILVELSEHNLYQIDRSLEAEAPEIARDAILADVRDRAAMSELFAQWRPDLVLHAAALKHVPIVERQPLAGLRTNVIGTRNVADAAREVGVRAMVLISTDKAVNPTNIMGASKRMAERYCQALDLESETRFVTVRFGNVLGSNGSVVPLFEEQIRAGGPVTVTHPDMTRYFMTIPEASQLVLHATRVALETDRYRGHIHVLDMGEPVKILNLAKRMIVLSGLKPGIDIDIVYTGLRPGEKLYEELFCDNEPQIGTGLSGVRIAASSADTSGTVFELVRQLETSVKAGDKSRSFQYLDQAINPNSNGQNALANNIVALKRTAPA